MKKILILGAGEMQVPIIIKCNSLGYQTIVTDYSENAPGFTEASVPLVIDTLDTEKNLEVAKEFQVDGVLTTSDAAVNTVAYICEKLSLPGLSRTAAKIATNKYLQREILYKNNLFSPRLVKTSKLGDVENKIANWTFPLVVKPVDSSASRGVIRVNAVKELRPAFTEAQKYSTSGNIIIEEFLKGTEYSVESITQHGITSVIAITEKYLIKDSDFFVEERHIIPANLHILQKENIINYVKRIIGLFQINNSATHIEIMLTKTGPVLIELGARLGGDYITSHLVPLSTGVDMEKNIILLALNEKIEVSPTLNKFAGIQFLHGKNYQSAKEILEEDNSWIKSEFKKFKDSPVKNSLDRLGYFIFQEESRERLIKKLNFNKREDE